MGEEGFGDVVDVWGGVGWVVEEVGGRREEESKTNITNAAAQKTFFPQLRCVAPLSSQMSQTLSYLLLPATLSIVISLLQNGHLDIVNLRCLFFLSFVGKKHTTFVQ